jgi:hypothetical protein
MYIKTPIKCGPCLEIMVTPGTASFWTYLELSTDLGTFHCMDDISGHFLARTSSWDISLHGRDFWTFLITELLFKVIKIVRPHQNHTNKIKRNVPKTCPCKEMSQNLVRTKKCPNISSVLRNVPRSRPCKETSQDLVRIKKCPKVPNMSRKTLFQVLPLFPDRDHTLLMP